MAGGEGLDGGWREDEVYMTGRGRVGCRWWVDWEAAG